MPTVQEMKSKMRLPAIAAPMFLVSGPDLVLAANKAGIIGTFPANNARTIDTLEEWFDRITKTVKPDSPPWAVNIMVHKTYTRMQEELNLAIKYRVPIIITALGSPAAIVDQVHGYGGLVLADVNSVTFAQKAAATGVDGLVLVAAGAGGHTGMISGFAFAPAVREFFNGIIVLGGAIGTGQAVRAAELLGADFAYLGTRFIPSTESMAPQAYKEMLITSKAEDIILSASMTGVPANWLRASLVAAGYDPHNMPEKKAMELGRPEDSGPKRWKEVWSAGQGVGSIHKIEPVSEIVDRLVAEYKSVT
ncbi:MAG: nitronate monooxygenase [Rhodospirillaceae bacterium]|nr:nitronate monooxygenase [Rhodospirillaceae bacterium]